MRILLTGAAGFAGSHALRHLLVNTDAEIVCPVSLDHKGRIPRLDSAIDGLDASRVQVLSADLSQPLTSHFLHLAGTADVIVNYASNSSVEESILEPRRFVENNVGVILTMLDFACTLPNLKAFVQVSTDEVYGAAGEIPHIEWSPIIPSNPYAASKAAQEAIAISYWRTFGIPLLLVNTMNMFAELQHPEKFIPTAMRKILNGESLPIYAAPDGTPGSRCWIHARNVADGILFLIQNRLPGRYQHVAGTEPRPDRYHIAGDDLTNLEMAQKLAAALGRTLHYHLDDVHSARPGHDLRYALDSSKMTSSGWKPPVSLEDGIASTALWTLAHKEWLEP